MLAGGEPVFNLRQRIFGYPVGGIFKYHIDIRIVRQNLLIGFGNGYLYGIAQHADQNRDIALAAQFIADMFHHQQADVCKVGADVGSYHILAGNRFVHGDGGNARFLKRQNARGYAVGGNRLQQRAINLAGRQRVIDLAYLLGGIVVGGYNRKIHALFFGGLFNGGYQRNVEFIFHVGSKIVKIELFFLGIRRREYGKNKRQRQNHTHQFCNLLHDTYSFSFFRMIG